MNFQSASVGGWAAAVAVSVLAVPSTSFGQAVQWKVSDGGNGHWYQYQRSVGDFWEKQARASGLGGYLATVHSQSENDLIAVLVGAEQYQYSCYAFLGGFQEPGAAEPSGGWRWVTDEPFDFTLWKAGEPNNQAGAENMLEFWWFDCGYRWNDGGFASASNDAPYIIEWSADCNSDGIVDYGQCRDGSLPDYNLNNIPDCCEEGVPCSAGNYPVQWRMEDGGNGHWYGWQQYGSFDSWTAMKYAAESKGGYLATIHSSGETSFLLSIMKGGSCAPLAGSAAYVGGYQPSGSGEPLGDWRWVTGEPWTYSEWLPGEPNDCCGGEDILGIMGTGGWNDGGDEAPCNASSVFEWSADCNSDGIVDYGQILNGTLVDADDNGIPDVCEIDPCPGDVNSSGVVNGTDIAIILGAWGTSGGKFPRSDANGDGVVDAADLAIVLGGWGPCP